MPIEVLCCLILVPHLLGLLSLARRGGRAAVGLILSAVFLGLGYLLVAGGSSSPATPANWAQSIDALARGPLAWVFLALPILVILSPLWAATRLRNH